MVIVKHAQSSKTTAMLATEPMSYGLALIASRTGGLLEVIENGIAWLFFEPGNFGDLSVKIDSL